ncbi:hypothetical protein CL654_01110 [bacterium]|nr:hypothetical protein [bacterium]|tara:strand:+ start:11243 stop:11692 length:450 start_codon:yes stop_codon:yes gene_type:complete
MKKEIENFVKNSRVAVFSVLRKDGNPHGATLHMSSKDDVSEIYFFTEKAYRKSEALLEGGEIPATVVIGFSEHEMKTLQLDGTAQVVGKEDLLEVQNIHFGKIKEAETYKDEPGMYFIRFIPTWWRYTVWGEDNNGEKTKDIICSEDEG